MALLRAERKRNGRLHNRIIGLCKQLEKAQASGSTIEEAVVAKLLEAIKGADPTIEHAELAEAEAKLDTSRVYGECLEKENEKLRSEMESLRKRLELKEKAEKLRLVTLTQEVVDETHAVAEVNRRLTADIKLLKEANDGLYNESDRQRKEIAALENEICDIRRESMRKSDLLEIVQRTSLML